MADARAEACLLVGLLEGLPEILLAEALVPAREGGLDEVRRMEASRNMSGGTWRDSFAKISWAAVVSWTAVEVDWRIRYKNRGTKRNR